MFSPWLGSVLFFLFYLILGEGVDSSTVCPCYAIKFYFLSISTPIYFSLKEFGEYVSLNKCLVNLVGLKGNA